MKRKKLERRLAMTGLVVGGAVSAFGCLDRPLEPVEPRTTTTIVERLTQSSVDKIDLLLGIDNSRSMADKQQILAAAVPDLVEGLVNPLCVDPANPGAAGVKVASPTDDCPTGLERDFDPVLDIHIGIITSSIGGHGSDACGAGAPDTASNNDKGHLVARTAPDATGTTVETYLSKGFLAWDPTQKLKTYDNAGTATAAPGEADITADTAADANTTALVPQLTDMVVGAGQIGCGFEAQLESWYRFLVDPEPYESISVPMPGGNATPNGIDTALLQQRADFMRPNSLLAIIVLTDENDCSVREGGQYYYATQLANPNGSEFHLPRPRAECATNPNDACCLSCGQTKPAECPDDPSCGGSPPTALTDLEDATNLRCFDQKRRFGIDFLYPIDRYVQGLSNVTIPNRAGEMVPNPIFSDLNPHDEESNIRDTGLVFFAGIVGVPWQDIARDPADLTRGFKNSDELRADVGTGQSTWDIILGDPTNYVAPADPHMIESIDPRSGTNPITGDTIQPPGSPNGADPINGHEWTPTLKDDLQYSCIFPLLPGTERDCSLGGTSCDCSKPAQDIDVPLCEPNPNDNNEPTLQVRAKAYPGLRELSLIKGLGAQGIVGSVCPAQLTNAGAVDYGYRPAIGAIIDRLKTALGGQCLPRTLTPDKATGRYPCLILEARKSDGQCDCNINGRSPVTEDHTKARDAVLADPLATQQQWDCVCEIVQIPNLNDSIDDAAELEACQYNLDEPVLTDASGEEVHGWCYIDGTTSPPVGDPQIVADCPATEKRIIRFVGEGEAQAGATLFITCSGE